VEADAELAEAERFQLLFAGLDSLHVLDGHRRSIRDARAEAGGRRAIPGGQAGQARELADLGFVEARIGERRGHVVLLGGVLSGAEIAQVVDIHPVDDVADGALAAELFEAREELVLAMETAVRVVADVIGIVEFVGIDELVNDAEARGLQKA
jgi:hypothetical protein